MDDDYKTKKNDSISKAFIDEFIHLSDDKKCEPLNILFSVPIWSSPDSTNLDSIILLW